MSNLSLIPWQDESQSIVGEEVKCPPQGESQGVVGDGDGDGVGVEAPIQSKSLIIFGDGGDAQSLVGVSESIATNKGQALCRRRKRKRIRGGEDDDFEHQVEQAIAVDSEDDCMVYGDEDCNNVDHAIGYGDNEVDNVLGVEEDINLNIEEDFLEVVRGDVAASDDDSGDDIWKEDNIPDPLSFDDEDELQDGDNDKDDTTPRDVEDPEVLLALEKTYNSPEDFKLTVLRYSLKTRYYIKLYRSQALIVAAKCCYVDEDGVKCPWGVYCSYERRKHKMQIKVYINEHICVRSGYSKMLKRSSIALLFEERLRLNPKLTKNDMAAEIKREYNLEVTPDQCAKAKTKVWHTRKASHESQFARIWDYQAEVFKSEQGLEI